MGNLQSSLGTHQQDILDAAISGDAAWLKRQIEEEPKLIESVTTARGLVKRRGVLHLAAKHGNADVISTVLEPLVERVREEFKVWKGVAAVCRGLATTWWHCRTPVLLQ